VWPGANSACSGLAASAFHDQPPDERWRRYAVKICSIVGARPQFVKAGVVSRALRRIAGVEEVLIHTGQHYDANMSRVFFLDLQIPEPRYNLAVGSGSHAAQTARMLTGLEDILRAEAPDVVLIYGDTNSTLAGAITAAKMHLPIAHVEAGLRSFNRRMPEEINRVLADAVADTLFAPSESSRQQLLREGHDPSRIFVSGDVMFDAALLMRDVARDRSSILDTLGLQSKGYYLATVHRAENTDVEERLQAILEALEDISKVLPVVMPLHPRTRAAFDRSAPLERRPSNIRFCDPVGYTDMARLEMDAAAILTDSGGVQKEAFFYGVRCFVLRDETEWTELIDAGWNTLVSPEDSVRIVSKVLDPAPWTPTPISPYGDGNAAESIATCLSRRYGATPGGPSQG
jgi:UDP-GlcNAc3NAcA epimerase